MRLEIHVYHHLDFEPSSAVGILQAILDLKVTIMSALSDLQAEVAQNSSVVDSAITLLQGLKAKLDEAIASGDPAALTALSAELDAKTNALAAAVQENTPAA